MTSKYIIGTYFDIKLTMFSLAPSATEEGAKGSQKGPQPSARARRRGAECPELLVYYKSVQKNIACHVFECCIKNHISDARDML